MANYVIITLCLSFLLIPTESLAFYQIPDQSLNKVPKLEGFQCGRLWAGQDFSGRSLTLGTKHTTMYSHFSPQSLQVRAGCSFTLVDRYGRNQTLSEDTPNIWRLISSPSSRVGVQVSACCDCLSDSCDGEKAQEGVECARFYKKEQCNPNGFKLDLKHGDTLNLKHLESISSLAVRPGCQVKNSHGGSRFFRFLANFTSTDVLEKAHWNKGLVDSVQCLCPNDKTVPRPSTWRGSCRLPVTIVQPTPTPTTKAPRWIWTSRSRARPTIRFVHFQRKVSSDSDGWGGWSSSSEEDGVDIAKTRVTIPPRTTTRRPTTATEWIWDEDDW